MQKLNYPLKIYKKAVEILAKRRGFSHADWYPTKGSIVRFELFLPNEEMPTAIWTVHHSHDRKEIIWSKDDYRKAAQKMNSTIEELEEILKSL